MSEYQKMEDQVTQPMRPVKTPVVTMGRSVYWRSPSGNVYSASVACVSSDGSTVNLCVLDHEGEPYGVLDVPVSPDPLAPLASQLTDNSWFWPPRV